VDIRKQRGQAIAEACKIDHRNGIWYVPSQSGAGRYVVRLDPDLPTCSCADWELRMMPCKHIHAVQFTLKRTENPDGSTTTTQTVTVTQTTPKKPTYRQKWPEYNRAQTNEKDRFQMLLAGLCRTIQNDAPPRKGQKPLPLSDAIFSACFKVYSTVSGRRFASDLREAVERGHITKAPHFNSIYNYLENPAVTEILRSLITQTALPLKAVELDFACDSSGFMTSRFDRWFDAKYGAPRQKQQWVKAHIMCGVKTNVVTAVEIHEPSAGDSPLLPALVDATAKNFTLREVSADKGYSSGENHDAIAKHNATPFIAFKNSTTGGIGGLFGTMFHFFSLHRETFLRSYHKRSNVETTFAMIKAKFGDSVRSKTDTAMKNEVLAKMVCHNIVCVIHELYEAGLEPTFWGQAVPA
jgi:Transposase DDE domain/SWIM zinc finger